MPDMSTLLWFVAGWFVVSLVVPLTFGALAARASRKREEQRRQSLAASLAAQRDRAERQRQAFAAVKGWHEPTGPRDGGDRAA